MEQRDGKKSTWRSFSKSEQRLHHKEDVFKHLLREQIADIASFLEAAVSILVLIALLLSVIPLLMEMPKLLNNDNEVDLQVFLGHAFTLVIGIEFIKMLAKHTPGSALEVLLYAIARHMIIGNGSAVDNILSLLAIGLIFVIRKFLFVPSFGATLPDGRPAPDVEATVPPPVSDPLADESAEEETIG